MKLTFTNFSLFILSILFSYTANAQINYSFNQSTATYTTVTGGTNAFPQVWDDDNQYVPIGFNFTFMGNVYSNLLIHSNGVLAFDTDQWGSPLSSVMPVITVFGDYGLGGLGADLIDRGDATGIAQSPVLYKTEGVAPNRVFIVEWKNAGFYDDGPSYNSFVNVQAKLYEGSNSIQIIMGSSSVASGLYEPGSSGPVIGLSTWDANSTLFLAGLLLSGNPSSAQTSNSYVALNGTPSTGTVYNFTAGSTAVAEIKEFKLSTFPNPVANELFVTLPSDGSFNEINIFDVNGKIILTQIIESSSKTIKIDVTGLAKGIYNLKLKGDESIGIAKFVK